jgi:hypothetical protein
MQAFPEAPPPLLLHADDLQSLIKHVEDASTSPHEDAVAKTMAKSRAKHSAITAEDEIM